MAVNRGEIWWADLGEPVGSAPGYRRPCVVVQADSFNRSRIGTVVLAAMTSNIALAKAPGNVYVGKRAGLRIASVVNVSALSTVDRESLYERCGRLTPEELQRVDAGLRLVLGL